MPQGSPVHAKIIVPWTEQLERESGGELRFEVHPEMRLGGTPESLYEQAVEGRVDIVWAMPSYTPGQFHRIEAFELPFVMKGRTATSLAAWDFAQRHAAEELAGVQPLSVHVIGSGGFHMRQAPVRCREDLRGLKVRVPTAQAAALMRALEATPVHLSPLRTREALASGEVDGVLMNWDFVNATRSYEVAPFHSETDPARRGLYTSAIVFAMNQARYAALPDDLRRLLDRRSGAALARWIGETFEQLDGRGRELARARGNVINVIGAQELDRWQDAADAVVAGWITHEDGRGADGAALVAQARALVDQHEAQLRSAISREAGA